MKIFNLILAVLFLGFALLQLNDSPGDILFWVLMYLLVSVISGFAAFNRYNMWVIVAGILVVVYQVFKMFPAFVLWVNSGMPSVYGEMKASTPHIELVREFMGLIICLIVLVYHFIRYRRIRKTTDTEVNTI